jgi:hypothetical protein
VDRGCRRAANGAAIKDRTGKRQIELNVGDYEIELAEPKEGLKLSTHKFSIIRDGRETVRSGSTAT